MKSVLINTCLMILILLSSCRIQYGIEGIWRQSFQHNAHDVLGSHEKRDRNVMSSEMNKSITPIYLVISEDGSFRIRNKEYRYAGTWSRYKNEIILKPDFHSRGVDYHFAEWRYPIIASIKGPNSIAISGFSNDDKYNPPKGYYLKKHSVDNRLSTEQIHKKVKRIVSETTVQDLVKGKPFVICVVPEGWFIICGYSFIRQLNGYGQEAFSLRDTSFVERFESPYFLTEDEEFNTRLKGNVESIIIRYNKEGHILFEDISNIYYWWDKSLQQQASSMDYE